MSVVRSQIHLSQNGNVEVDARVADCRSGDIHNLGNVICQSPSCVGVDADANAGLNMGVGVEVHVAGDVHVDVDAAEGVNVSVDVHVDVDVDAETCMFVVRTHGFGSLYDVGAIGWQDRDEDLDGWAWCSWEKRRIWGLTTGPPCGCLGSSWSRFLEACGCVNTQHTMHDNV